jgi:GNAT superfamily N-acetyltransferase
VSPEQAARVNSLPLEIRRYRPADHDAVWDLHNLALNQVNAHGGNGAWDDDLHHVRQVYLDAGGEFLVGTLDERIVAMGGLKRTGPARAKVVRMRVHPDLQRRGLGRQILAALEARATALGYTRLWLDTTTRQPAAQAFYQKNGYRQTGADTYGPFELLIYEKAL